MIFGLVWTSHLFYLSPRIWIFEFFEFSEAVDRKKKSQCSTLHICTLHKNIFKYILQKTIEKIVITIYNLNRIQYSTQNENPCKVLSSLYITFACQSFYFSFYKVFSTCKNWNENWMNWKFELKFIILFLCKSMFFTAIFGFSIFRIGSPGQQKVLLTRL